MRHVCHGIILASSARRRQLCCLLLFMHCATTVRHRGSSFHRVHYRSHGHCLNRPLDLNITTLYCHKITTWQQRRVHNASLPFMYRRCTFFDTTLFLVSQEPPHTRAPLPLHFHRTKKTSSGASKTGTQGGLTSRCYKPLRCPGFTAWRTGVPPKLHIPAGYP